MPGRNPDQAYLGAFKIHAIQVGEVVAVQAFDGPVRTCAGKIERTVRIAFTEELERLVNAPARSWPPRMTNDCKRSSADSPPPVAGA